VESVGWRWAFPLLAVGPAAGIVVMNALRTARARVAAPVGAR
jgi:hypothetical protein